MPFPVILHTKQNPQKHKHAIKRSITRNRHPNTKEAQNLTDPLTNHLQRSARGGIMLVIGQIASTLITAIGIIIVARLLGSTTYGDITVSIVPISIASLLTDLGINAALIKYISQLRTEGRTADISTLVRTGLAINTGIGILLSTAVYLSSGYLATAVFNQPGIQPLIQIASLNILAQSLVNTTRSIFVGHEKMGTYSATVIFFSILKSILAPLLVIMGYGPLGAIMGNTAPLLITGIFGLAITILMTPRRPVQGYSTLNHRQGAALLLRYGYPLFFSTILAGALTQIYSFLMALHANSHNIGNYQAAVNFSVLITFFTMPIATVLFPLFSKLNPNDERLATIFRNSVTYAALITAPVTMALILLAEPLVETIYSGTYTLTPLYMKLYLLTFLFIGLGNLSVVSLLNGQGNTKITLRIHLINIAIGVPLSLWLIPNHGIVGLIATTIITSQMGQTYGLLWIKRNLDFTIDLRKTVKIYTASTISFIILYAIFTVVNLGSIPTILVGSASYATLYILLILSLKTIGQEDINNLRQVFSAMGPLTPLFTYVLNRLEKFIPRGN